MYFMLITTHKYIFTFGKINNQQNPLKYFQADQDTDRSTLVYLMADSWSPCPDSLSKANVSIVL